MFSPQSEADLLEGRKTRRRTSASTSNAIICATFASESEKENEKDEEFFVGEKQKKKTFKKKRASIPKTDVSSMAPMKQPTRNKNGDSTVKTEREMNSQKKNPSSFPTISVVQVENKFDKMIPKIVPNKDRQGTQLLFAQASILPSTPIPSMKQEAETSCTCAQSPSATTTTPISQQVRGKTLPSQLQQQYTPGQSHIQSKSHSARLSSEGRRGREQSVGQLVPSTSARARQFAPGAPRPVPPTVKPSPPSRSRQKRPRLSGCQGLTSQQHSPSIGSSVSQLSMNAGLSSLGPIQCVLSTPESQLVAHPPVVEVDTDSSSPHHPNQQVAPNNCSIPSLALPPSISITRKPPVISRPTDAGYATNLASLASTLGKLEDTRGEQCLVAFELTEVQLEGLRELGLKEKKFRQ